MDTFDPDCSLATCEDGQIYSTGKINKRALIVVCEEREQLPRKRGQNVLTRTFLRSDAKLFPSFLRNAGIETSAIPNISSKAGTTDEDPNRNAIPTLSIPVTTPCEIFVAGSMLIELPTNGVFACYASSFGRAFGCRKHPDAHADAIAESKRIPMDLISAYLDAVVDNWPIWLVTLTLIVAAVIDGFELKVPNWITFPLVISGWIYSLTFASGMGMTWYEGLGWSLLGTLVGLALLLPAYMIGGMGAGDVKLLAGVGAWIHVTHTFNAFALSAVIGAVLAILMVLYRRSWQKHSGQFWFIVTEILTVKDPEKLATIAAERKSSMLLLPYGIPIAMGTIAYFAWSNMLV